ncbi:bile acid:sodium symporter [Aureococcus anophagefferens]|nr:bile acid:sodium symporter [Aureococcus anophagefferens]
MPVLGLGLGKLWGLDPAMVAGMVLVGSINGGQASNLCTFIAKGNVALSVLMATAAAIGAIFMTPFLCKAFLGTVVPVDARGIVVSTLQVVLAPIVLGMTLNEGAARARHAHPPRRRRRRLLALALLGFGETSRTMAIETSMKSSAFGFLLAKLHFGDFACRVPSAVSVVWMALTGSSMAVAWRFMKVNPPKFDRNVRERFEKVDVISIVKRTLGKK